MTDRRRASWTRRALSISALCGWGLSAATTLAAPPSAREAWRQALGFFKQKRFDAACPLFESAATSEKTNGAIWADLGLCELKRGNSGASVHASLLAARYGTEKVRKNAYFNLNLAEYRFPLPGQQCAEVSAVSEAECAESIFACTREFRSYGTGAGDSGVYAIFASARETAQLYSDDTSISANSDAPSSLELSEHHECLYSWCTLHEEETSCMAECHEGTVRDCNVVYVDPCQGRVGYVCEFSELNPESSKLRIEARELALESKR
jgi:hypothetical protein